MFNYKKAKEMLDLAKKLGPEYEALVKWNMNSVYGVGCNNVSMYKQEMHDDCLPRRSGRYPWKTDGLLYMESQEIIHDLENDIKCHMRNAYGIKNPKVTVNDNNEVTINVSDGDYYITNVIFNDPATIVFWSDGTKTVVKCCKDDTFDKEKGLAMAILKKLSWNDSKAFHRGLRRWIKPEPEPEIESSISKPFANWGEIVRRIFNDYINLCLSKADSEEKEYTIICPCCSNRIYIPSKYEFFNNGGTTRCAKCGLEIHMSSEKEEKTCRPENTEK